MQRFPCDRRKQRIHLLSGPAGRVQALYGRCRQRGKAFCKAVCLKYFHMAALGGAMAALVQLWGGAMAALAELWQHWRSCGSELWQLWPELWQHWRNCGAEQWRRSERSYGSSGRSYVSLGGAHTLFFFSIQHSRNKLDIRFAILTSQPIFKLTGAAKI